MRISSSRKKYTHKGMIEYTNGTNTMMFLKDSGIHWLSADGLRFRKSDGELTGNDKPMVLLHLETVVPL